MNTKFELARALVAVLERDPELAAELSVVLKPAELLDVLHLRSNGTPKGTPIPSTVPLVTDRNRLLERVSDWLTDNAIDA